MLRLAATRSMVVKSLYKSVLCHEDQALVGAAGEEGGGGLLSM